MKKNHVHKSLTKTLIVFGVPFTWFLAQFSMIGMMMIWFDLYQYGFLIFIAVHLWAVFQTRHDPQWVEVFLVRGKFFKNAKRNKRYIA